MAVIAQNELPRTYRHRFGESPTSERRIICTLDTPETASADIVTACGVLHGAQHPETAWAATRVMSVEVNEMYEGSRYHVEVVATYEVPEIDLQSYTVEPWLRPDVWSFQTQGVTVPAFFYFDGTTKKPLTNSAHDYFEGLTIDEAQQKVIIKGARQNFPSGIAAALTNCVNNGTFLGGPAHSWKCQGISGEVAYEVINSVKQKYWNVTVELLYRQTGWNLLLPDVGFNFISGNEKRRAMVYDDKNGEWVASANPVALNGSGGLSAASAPTVLTRRIYSQADFATYFGTPPT